MRAAHYWRVWPPSKFYDASLEDQALAIEFYETEMKIQAYQSKIDQQEMKRPGGGSSGFFEE
jgi:hypothetical protein